MLYETRGKPTVKYIIEHFYSTLLSIGFDHAIGLDISKTLIVMMK